ncbi:MAG: isopentenyl-diphosphate delta-isomerase, partial [Candidatus Woesearchaeota archaeon]
ENEVDRVFVAFSDEKPNPNPEEVDDYKYIKINELYEDIKNNPDNYTYWFKQILNHEKFLEYIKNQSSNL